MFSLSFSTTSDQFQQNKELWILATLKTVAERVMKGETHGKIIDINGNSIGTFTVSQDDR